MDYQELNQYNGVYSAAEEYEPLNRYTAKTFGWMAMGLLATFTVAMGLYLSNLIWYVFAIPYAVFVLGIAELVVVIYMSSQINKVSVGTARALFFTYAVLNGVVFSAYPEPGVRLWGNGAVFRNHGGDWVYNPGGSEQPAQFPGGRPGIFAGILAGWHVYQPGAF